MTQRGQHRKNGAARPITTKRDYLRAGEVVKKLNQEVERETAAERRLQALIREMDKYDEETDDYGYEPDFSIEFETGGPRRRWSDDPNDLD